MSALALFLTAAWVLTAAGRRVVGWLRLPEGATPLERNLIAYALGLGLLAYGMLLLGLPGLLRPGAALLLLIALLILGERQHVDMAQEGKRMWRAMPRLQSPRNGALAGLFLAFAAVCFAGVYAPPTLIEWDSLAYHLADPKLYVQAHRIYYVPWEDHSNFAFTAEMWYTFGLLLGSVPLAKLFHFACAAGTCLAIYAFGARHLHPRIGVWAALLFASTPLVFWEAGTAYVDLALTFFATLTLLAVANGIKTRNKRWLLIGAILMGLTLSTKATALTTLALFVLGLLFWRLRVHGQPVRKAVGQVAVWCVLALVVGSPWYIKSTVYTGNPVYPFFYHLFGGRYWNAENAGAYDASNAAFGMGHRLVDALLLPWNLTQYLLPGHLTSWTLPFNNFQTPLGALSPVLLTALFFPAFGLRTPPVVKVLGLYALMSILLWFEIMQYVRYLLPTLPVLCLLACWTLHRTLQNRWASGYALGGMYGLSLAFSLFVGAQLLSVQAPVVLGRQTKDDYIAANFPAYPAIQFVNTQLPSDAKIVMYGSPLGFYCDKPYLWGEAGHSTFIPYGQFHSADDLRHYFQRQHITHILINANPRYFAFRADAKGYAGWVYQLTAGSGPPLFSRRGVFVYALPPDKA